MIKAADVEKWKHRLHDKEEKQRIADAKELYRIYTHDWRDLLEEYLRLLFSEQTWQELRLQAATDLNTLRWAADELAPIYSKSPVRSVDGITSDEDGDDPLDPYTAGGTLDLALDQAARLCYATRAVLLRPLVANAPSVDEEGNTVPPPHPDLPPHMTLDVIPHHKAFVIPDKHDMTRPALVVVQKKNCDWIAWDKEEQVLVDSHTFAIKRQQPNPYGCIPYVVAHASFPCTHYWSTSEAYGLRDATYQIGAAKTDHNHLRKLQSHKQGWYRNDDDVALSVLTDPGAWVHLTGNSEVGLLDMQADLTAHLDSLLSSAAATLALYGIRPESVRGTLDASSGYALSIKLLSQEKVWGQQRRVWEVWEQRLYEIAREVLRVDAGIQLPAGTLQIDWAEIGAKASPTEQIDYYAKLRADDLVSRGWVRRQIGLTPEEIEQIEEELQEEKASRMLNIPPALQSSNPSPPPSTGETEEDDEDQDTDDTNTEPGSEEE